MHLSIILLHNKCSRMVRLCPLRVLLRCNRQGLLRPIHREQFNQKFCRIRWSILDATDWGDCTRSFWRQIWKEAGCCSFVVYDGILYIFDGMFTDIWASWGLEYCLFGYMSFVPGCQCRRSVACYVSYYTRLISYIYLCGCWHIMCAFPPSLLSSSATSSQVNVHCGNEAT